MGKPRKIIAVLISLCLIFEQSGFAQIASQFDISGLVSGLATGIVSEKFRPLHLRYLSYDSLQNNFQLLLDKGDTRETNKEALEESTKKLLEYFFVGIALPNDDFWVNLRPDAPEDIINDDLAKTDVGKILLEADLQLKKDTASYTSPKTREGKEYWDKLYKRAADLYGTENVTIPTLTRPWIVPDEIIVRESQGSAYIYKATLKVMLEQDYLKGSATYNFQDERLKQLNEYSSELIRQAIIPKITREINSAKRYAPLRQVYYSLILAQWYKEKHRSQGQEVTKSQVDNSYIQRIDSKDLTRLISNTPWSKDTYFRAYQKSFKEGEYNIKEPAYSSYGQTIRSYFSGGIAFMGSASLDGGSSVPGISQRIQEGLIKTTIAPTKAFIKDKLNFVISAIAQQIRGNLQIEINDINSAAKPIQAADVNTIAKPGSIPSQAAIKGWKDINPVFPIDSGSLPNFKRWIFRFGTEFGSNWNWPANSEVRIDIPGYGHPAIDIFEYEDNSGAIKMLADKTPLRAVIDGIVIRRDSEGIVIQSGDRYVVYEHIEPTVQLGQRVRGSVDTVGLFSYTAAESVHSTPHVHLQVLEYRGDLAQEEAKYNRGEAFLNIGQKYSFDPLLIWEDLPRRLEVTQKTKETNTRLDTKLDGGKPISEEIKQAKMKQYTAMTENEFGNPLSLNSAGGILKDGALFHGTNRQFKDFIIPGWDEDVQIDRTLGGGVYFVDNYEQGLLYANNRVRQRNSGSPRVVIARLIRNNLLDCRKGLPEEISEELLILLDKSPKVSWLQDQIWQGKKDYLNQQKKLKAPVELRTADFNLADTPGFKEALINRGYDGLIYTEGGEGSGIDKVGVHNSIVVFDPANIITLEQVKEFQARSLIPQYGGEVAAQKDGGMKERVVEQAQQLRQQTQDLDNRLKKAQSRTLLTFDNAEELAAITNKLKKETVVVLSSCSTGRQADGSLNLANKFSSVLRGISVLAPRHISKKMRLVFGKDNRVVNFEYENADEWTLETLDDSIQEHLKETAYSTNGNLGVEESTVAGKLKAVVIFPEYDYNGAFERLEEEVAQLREKGYEVRYRRVRTIDELIDFVQESKDQDIDLLIIGGHGTQNSLHLGAISNQDRSGIYVSIREFYRAAVSIMNENRGFYTAYQRNHVLPKKLRQLVKLSNGWFKYSNGVEALTGIIEGLLKDLEKSTAEDHITANLKELKNQLKNQQEEIGRVLETIKDFESQGFDVKDSDDPLLLSYLDQKEVLQSQTVDLQKEILGYEEQLRTEIQEGKKIALAQNNSEKITQPQGGAVQQDKAMDISNTKMVGLIEALSGADPAIPSQKVENFRIIFENLPQLAQRIAQGYRQLAKEYAVDVGKIEVFLVGGRARGEPLRESSDIDMILAVENFDGRFGLNEENYWRETGSVLFKALQGFNLPLRIGQKYSRRLGNEFAFAQRLNQYYDGSHQEFSDYIWLDLQSIGRELEAENRQKITEGAGIPLAISDRGTEAMLKRDGGMVRLSDAQNNIMQAFYYGITKMDREARQGDKKFEFNDGNLESIKKLLAQPSTDYEQWKDSLEKLNQFINSDSLELRKRALEVLGLILKETLKDTRKNLIVETFWENNDLPDTLAELAPEAKETIRQWRGAYDAELDRLVREFEAQQGLVDGGNKASLVLRQLNGYANSLVNLIRIGIKDFNTITRLIGEDDINEAFFGDLSSALKFMRDIKELNPQELEELSKELGVDFNKLDFRGLEKLEEIVKILLNYKNNIKPMLPYIKNAKTIIDQIKEEMKKDNVFLYDGEISHLIIMATEMLMAGKSTDEIKTELSSYTGRYIDSFAGLPLVSMGMELEVFRDFVPDVPFVREGAETIIKLLNIKRGGDGIIEYAFGPSRNFEAQVVQLRFLRKLGLVPDNGAFPVHVSIGLPKEVNRISEQDQKSAHLLANLLGLVYSPVRRFNSTNHYNNFMSVIRLHEKGDADTQNDQIRVEFRVFMFVTGLDWAEGIWRGQQKDFSAERQFEQLLKMVDALSNILVAGFWIPNLSRHSSGVTMEFAKIWDEFKAELNGILQKYSLSIETLENTRDKTTWEQKLLPIKENTPALQDEIADLLQRTTVKIAEVVQSKERINAEWESRLKEMRKSLLERFNDSITSKFFDFVRNDNAMIEPGFGRMGPLRVRGGGVSEDINRDFLGLLISREELRRTDLSVFRSNTSGGLNQYIRGLMLEIPLNSRLNIRPFLGRNQRDIAEQRHQLVAFFKILNYLQEKLETVLIKIKNIEILPVDIVDRPKSILEANSGIKEETPEVQGGQERRDGGSAQDNVDALKKEWMNLRRLLERMNQQPTTFRDSGRFLRQQDIQKRLMEVERIIATIESGNGLTKDGGKKISKAEFNMYYYPALMVYGSGQEELARLYSFDYPQNSPYSRLIFIDSSLSFSSLRADKALVENLVKLAVAAKRGEQPNTEKILSLDAPYVLTTNVIIIKAQDDLEGGLPAEAKNKIIVEGKQGILRFLDIPNKLARNLQYALALQQNRMSEAKYLNRFNEFDGQSLLNNAKQILDGRKEQPILEDFASSTEGNTDGGKINNNLDEQRFDVLFQRCKDAFKNRETVELSSEEIRILMQALELSRNTEDAKAFAAKSKLMLILLSLSDEQKSEKGILMQWAGVWKMPYGTLNKDMMRNLKEALSLARTMRPKITYSFKKVDEQAAESRESKPARVIKAIKERVIEDLVKKGRESEIKNDIEIIKGVLSCIESRYIDAKAPGTQEPVLKRQKEENRESLRRALNSEPNAAIITEKELDSILRALAYPSWDVQKILVVIYEHNYDLEDLTPKTIADRTAISNANVLFKPAMLEALNILQLRPGGRIQVSGLNKELFREMFPNIDDYVERWKSEVLHESSTRELKAVIPQIVRYINSLSTPEASVLYIDVDNTICFLDGIVFPSDRFTDVRQSMNPQISQDKLAEQCKYFLEKADEAGIIKVVPGIDSILNAAKARAVEVVLLSNRPESIRDLTQKTLNRKLLEIGSYVPQKLVLLGKEDKKTVFIAKDMKARNKYRAILIDDQAKNTENNGALKSFVLPTKPWTFSYQDYREEIQKIVDSSANPTDKTQQAKLEVLLMSALLSIAESQGNEQLGKLNDLQRLRNSSPIIDILLTKEYLSQFASELTNEAKLDGGSNIDISDMLRKEDKGGIDLRTLPIATQPMPTPLAPAITGQPDLKIANLAAEWRQIEGMVSVKMIPSSQRIKEFLMACCAKGELSQHIDDVLVCIADILRIEEEKAVKTEPALKDVLILLESNMPAKDLQSSLNRVTVATARL